MVSRRVIVDFVMNLFQKACIMVRWSNRKILASIIFLLSYHGMAAAGTVSFYEPGGNFTDSDYNGPITGGTSSITASNVDLANQNFQINLTTPEQGYAGTLNINTGIFQPIVFRST